MVDLTRISICTFSHLKLKEARCISIIGVHMIERTPITCNCFLRLPGVYQYQPRWMPTGLWNLANVGTASGGLSTSMWKVEISKGDLNITSTRWNSLHSRKSQLFLPGVWWPKFIHMMNVFSCKASLKS